MTRIEVLFPEFCSLFADSSNIRYPEKCLPDAEFVFTSYMDEPLFVKEQPDLIYMGAMTESAQEKIIRKLMPYKARIAELIAADVPMLFTNNAVEILDSILRMKTVQRSKRWIYIRFMPKGDMMHRFNCLVRGHLMILRLSVLRHSLLWLTVRRRNIRLFMSIWNRHEQRNSQ